MKPWPKWLRWANRDWHFAEPRYVGRTKTVRRVPGFREVVQYRVQVDMNSGDTREVVQARWVEIE